MIGARELAEALGRPAPTDEQIAVIEAPLAPALVVAGAGSGKTETMASRVVWLVANGMVGPERVLGLTFTCKAVGELAERVRTRLGLLGARGLAPVDPLGSLSQPTVATYNAYASGIVRDHGLRLGLDPAAVLLGEAQRWQLMYDLVMRYPGEGGDVELSAGTLTSAALQLADRLAEHQVTTESLREFLATSLNALRDLPRAGRKTSPGDALNAFASSVPTRVLLADLVDLYREAKREGGMMDFADQVAGAADLVEAFPAIGRAERARFDCVLLDEYQDTSPAQLRVLSGLFSGGFPVMAVGDPHQSIYAWRGASAGSLADFPDVFARADTEAAAVLSLSIAWRNDRVILDAANTIAEPLCRSVSVHVPPLATRPGVGPGDLARGYFATIADEAGAVAEWFATRWGTPGGETGAVLCRRRSDFAVFAAALRERGLPVEVVGLGGLLDAPEVVEILATIRAAHDPSRGDQAMRLIAGSRASLGAADLAVFDAWARQLGGRQPSETTPVPEAGEVSEAQRPGLIEALEQLPPHDFHDGAGRTLSSVARARLERLARTLARVRALSYLAVPDLILATERALGLDVDLLARRGPGGRTHVEALVAQARVFASAPGAGGLDSFLDWLDAASEREDGLTPGEVEVDPSAIQVLTVHAAKGLEWDLVAVTRLTDGSFPKLSRDGATLRPRDSGWLSRKDELPYPLRADARHLPELDIESLDDVAAAHDAADEFRFAVGSAQELDERRVAYVALTRARNALAITGSYWADDAKGWKAPSPFYTEVADLDGVATLGEDPEPDEGATNPLAALARTAMWPADPLGARRPAVERAAAWVAQADPASLDPADERVELARLLLTERDRPAVAETDLAVTHLSVTDVQRIARDAERFAAERRRPMPQRPRPAARRGSLFHAWVESYLLSPALIDIDDDSLDVHAFDGPADAPLDELRRAFETSEWAVNARGLILEACEVELDFPVAGRTLRSKADAVFRAPDGQVVIVDWKTGRPPTDPEEIRIRDIQLALYRLGYSLRHGIALDRIETYYHYVLTGHTQAPLTVYSVEELERLVSLAPGGAEGTAGDPRVAAP